MSHYNNQKIVDLKEKCKSYMAEQGLVLQDQLITDGTIKRYSSDSKKSKPDEWYIAYEGYTSNNNAYLICIFGSWSTGSKYEFKSFENDNKFNDQEKKQLKQILHNQHLQLEQAIKSSYENSAKKAQRLWNEYFENPPSDEYNRYTKLKGIEPIGIKYGLNQQGLPSIVIPLRNAAGELRSLQYISLDNNGTSDKKFLAGGEKKGNFHILGNILNLRETVFITEGYATAVSVYEATNKPVIIAFDAGNLEKVVENIKNKFPEISITIAADNDEIGIKKATEAANKFGGKTVFPLFEKENERKGKDFNDLHQILGINEVKKQLTQINIPENDLKKLAESYITNKEEPCENFKLSSLPLPLNEYISVICKTTNAHPIMVTSSVLTMISAFIGTKVLISEEEYFQNLYPNLWILCVAKSGQFKTTALNKGAKISFDKQSQVFKSIKEIQNNSNTEDQIEKLILNKSLENVVLPTKQTAEGFLEYLSQGHQGAVYASEFGGWLQNLDKSHNNDFKAILTEFYDVPSYYRYKTKTQGDCIIETPYISICGVSTMPWIRHNLKPSDVPSGFFARFLIFLPPYQDGIPPAFPTSLEETYVMEEKKFKNFLDQILEQISNSRTFHLTKEARELIEGFHQYIYRMPEKYSEKAKEILEPYLKRWSPYLIKLSMITQLFIDPKTDQISNAAVISAMSILIPAMKSTACLFEGELGESVHQRKCRIVFEFICKKIKETGKPIKRQTIFSSKKLEGGGKEYDEILQSLIDQGKIGFNKVQNKMNESEYYLIEEFEKA